MFAALQERVQFLGDHIAGARLRTGIAVAESGAVVGANAREFRDLAAAPYAKKRRCRPGQTRE